MRMSERGRRCGLNSGKWSRNIKGGEAAAAGKQTKSSRPLDRCSLLSSLLRSAVLRCPRPPSLPPPPDLTSAPICVLASLEEWSSDPSSAYMAKAGMWLFLTLYMHQHLPQLLF